MTGVANSKRVTYEEWLRMPKVDDAIEEVVNGEIRIMPPHKWEHQRIVELTCDALRHQLGNHQYFLATGLFGLIIRKSPLTSRVPDLAVFELGNLMEQEGYLLSAPQLLMLVRSPSNTQREHEDELADYASLGVPEVWVVSPDARTVEVLYLEDGLPRRAHVLAKGALTPKRLPQVKVHIAAIWPN
jgi:Uma2 family endonuclease